MRYRKFVAGVLLLVSVGIVPATYATEATLKEIYQVAAAGRLDEAQSLMAQVLRDHPNSGKAHFVEAELLVQQGRVSEAAAELKTARELSPGLSFAKPDAVRKLEERVGLPSSVSNMVSTTAARFSPATVVLIGAGVIVLFVVMGRALRRPSNVMMGSNGTVQGPFAGSAPIGTPMSGGSGILGSLATGAAVGAGVVAGEALMHRVLDGGHRDDYLVTDDESRRTISDPGLDPDFGVTDNSSWDDSSSFASGDDWT